MISLVGGIYNMTQMKLSMKQKQNPGIENRLAIDEGEMAGGGMEWEVC